MMVSKTDEKLVDCSSVHPKDLPWDDQKGSVKAEEMDNQMVHPKGQRKEY